MNQGYFMEIQRLSMDSGYFGQCHPKVTTYHNVLLGIHEDLIDLL